MSFFGDVFEDTREMIKEMLYHNNDIIQYIYVNDALLDTINGGCDHVMSEERKGEVFEINGMFFEDIQRNDEEEFFEFEIVKKMGRSRERERKYWESAGGEYDDTYSALDALTIQNIKNGVIVNSNVFLSEENWHTLMRTDGINMMCAVCSTLCPILYYENHIASEHHQSNLRAHQPLDYYDLCIMRKIGEKYHCGVCNLFTDSNELDQHLASKSHEDLLLYAINQVSDIVDQADSFQECSQSQSQEDDVSEGFYEDCSSLSPNNNGYVASTDDSDEQDALTYASMASTPAKTSKRIEVDMGQRKVWVQADTWHMIVTLKPNNFYCMVCRTEGPMNKKVKHCSKEQHVENLKKCPMVKKYEHHLVRMVGNKFLHCGHCNNLRLTSDIDDHLKFRHPINKGKNLNDQQKDAAKITSAQGAARSNITADCIQSVQADSARSSNTTGGQQSVQANQTGTNSTTVPGQAAANPTGPRNEPKNMVELTLFGSRMAIPVLHFMMVVIGNGLYCCLCEKRMTVETVNRHLRDDLHLEKLKQAHFIPDFNCNLIRPIPGSLHCGICNVVVPHSLIFFHIRHYIHLHLLSIAVIATLIPAPIPEHIQVNNNNAQAAHQSSNQFSILKEVSDSSESKIPSPRIDCNNTSQSISVDNAVQGIVESITDEEEPIFDVEDSLYVKVDSKIIKISTCSYNTLVALGDGTRHCFLCSESIPMDKLGEHVRRRDHEENIQKNKFLDKRKISLLRQQYVTFHCGVCNVIVQSRYMDLHLKWSVHLQNETLSSITKKSEKKKLKAKKQYDVTFQREIIYTNAVEPEIKILKSFKYTKEASKKYKMVIVNGSVARIEWHAWHSFCKVGETFKCCLCQKTLNGDIIGHSEDPVHVKATENFLDMYLPALIRLCHGEKLHCATCNMELVKHHSVFAHIYAKSHKETYKSILKSSSEAESFVDCSRDVFTVGKD